MSTYIIHCEVAIKSPFTHIVVLVHQSIPKTPWMSPDHHCSLLQMPFSDRLVHSKIVPMAQLCLLACVIMFEKDG